MMFYHLRTAILLSFTVQLFALDCPDLQDGANDKCPDDGSIIMPVQGTNLPPDFIYGIDFVTETDDEGEDVEFVLFEVDTPPPFSDSTTRTYVQFSDAVYNAACLEIDPACGSPPIGEPVIAKARCMEKENGAGSFAVFTVFVTEQDYVGPQIDKCCDQDNTWGTRYFTYAILCDCPSNTTPDRRLRVPKSSNNFEGIQEYIDENL